MDQNINEKKTVKTQALTITPSLRTEPGVQNQSTLSWGGEREGNGMDKTPNLIIKKKIGNQIWGKSG